MSRSTRITQEDFRGVFRLLGDVRDLRHDVAAQERCIVDGLCNLIGAPMGWAAAFENFRPGADTAITRLVPGAIECPTTLGCLASWGTLDDYEGDPLVKAGRHSTRRADAVARSGLMPYEGWADYSVFKHFAQPSKIHDSMALWFRLSGAVPEVGVGAGADAIRGYALQRSVGEQAFSPKATALARVFAEELAVLHDEGRLAPPPPEYSAAALTGLPPELAPRLRRLAGYLTTAMSQKQIAREMGLSYHTVRSYTKELYGSLRVGSREALAAKLRK